VGCLFYRETDRDYRRRSPRLFRLTRRRARSPCGGTRPAWTCCTSAGSVRLASWSGSSDSRSVNCYAAGGFLLARSEQLLFAGTNSSVTGFASEKRRQKAPHRHGARAGPSRGGRRARLRWIRPSFVSMQASWRAMCGMSPGLDLSDLSEGPGCAGATGFRVFDICHAVHKTSPHLRNSATAFPLLSLRARLPTQSTS
jgi:hypothetical protein